MNYAICKVSAAFGMMQCAYFIFYDTHGTICRFIDIFINFIILLTYIKGTFYGSKNCN